MNEPIGLALDEIRALIDSQDALVDLLDADAVLARVDHAPCADGGAEFVVGLPRLLTLLTTDELGLVRPWEITRRLPEHAWHEWPSSLRAAVANLFDQWWLTVLSSHPSSPPTTDVLAALVALELPLSRWLHPLLRSFDGPGARHLFDIVMEELEGEGWEGHDDERQQILAWCRTEPVVMGVTLVGAVHLAEGQFGELLDALL